MIEPRCQKHIEEREGAGYFPCSPYDCNPECIEAMQRKNDIPVEEVVLGSR